MITKKKNAKLQGYDCSESLLFCKIRNVYLNYVSRDNSPSTIMARVFHFGSDLELMRCFETQKTDLSKKIKSSVASLLFSVKECGTDRRVISNEFLDFSIHR